MYFKQLLIYGVVSVILSTATVAGMKKDKYDCQISSPCTCVSANNINIDLADMNLNLNLTSNVTLNYQPCPNDEHNTTSVTIQMTNATSPNETTVSDSLAYYKDVNFKIGDAVTLVYENDTNKFVVILSCEPTAVKGHEYLTDFQNNTNNHLTITLKTSMVCGLNLKDSIENSSSSSWSSFFSLLLFVAFIYFVGGSVVNACLYNEIGINMIPHHAFWSSVCNYIQGKLCGSSTMASTYESI